MFSHTHSKKTVIAIDDISLSYVTVDKNEHGFFIDQHETVTLPEGIIVRGEILKADLLFGILKKIAVQIENKRIDILLSHEYFLCDDAELATATKKGETLKKRVQNYFKHEAKSESWHKTHVCEFSTHMVHGKEKVLFKCLPKDIQKSYVHVLKRAGFKVSSISSDILAFDHLLQYERTSLVCVGKKHTRVVEFKSGMYTSHKTFQVSYEQFKSDIKKLVGVSDTEATSILMKHGLLRSHKDEKVYSRLQRSASPLIDFLSKRKIKESLEIKVIFEDQPILGFTDTLMKSLRLNISELDVLHTGAHVFQDILVLHRDDSYRYQSLIAQALKFWKK